MGGSTLLEEGVNLPPPPCLGCWDPRDCGVTVVGGGDGELQPLAENHEPNGAAVGRMSPEATLDLGETRSGRLVPGSRWSCH